MPLKLVLWPLLGCVALVGSLSTAQAPPTPDPLVADIVAYEIDDQMWLWHAGSDAPQMITAFEDEWNVDGVTTAPNGGYVAFLATTSIEEPGRYPTYVRDSLWLYDVTSGVLEQIDGLDPNEDGYADGRYKLGSLEFAPDSSELMWLEIDFETGMQFIFYNLAQQTRRTLPNTAGSGYQDGGDVSIPSLEWGAGGLFNAVFGMNDDYVFERLVQVIDIVTADNQTFKIWEEVEDADPEPKNFSWAEADGQPVIAYSSDADWYALNPQENTITRYASAPTTSYAGYVVTGITADNCYRSLPSTYTLTTPTGDPVVLPDGVTAFAVTTGGTGVIFAGFEFIGAWEAGSARLFDESVAVSEYIVYLRGAPPITRFDDADALESRPIEPR